MGGYVLKKVISVFLFSVVSGHAAAATLNLQNLVIDAFAALESEVQDRWQFTEASDDGEFKRLARYNPQAPEGQQWLLITVDGRAASDDEVAEFRRQKREQKERENERNGGAETNPLDSIDLESLRLLEDNASAWRIGFTPIGAGEGRKMMAQMQGIVSISKSGLCVEYLEIASPGPVKPQIGVKVNHFLSRFEFAPVGEPEQQNAQCGRLLPVAMQFEINMRAFGVMAVDRTMSARYSDYQVASAR